MTKSLVFLAAGALALTACTSQDEVNSVLTSKNNVIKFENVVNKHSRADITTEDLTHFNVFGFYTMPGNDKIAHQVFYNTDVNWVKGAWDYSTGYGERYWIPGAKYYFYAYSCNNTIISDEIVTEIGYKMDMQDGINATDRVLEIDNYVCNNDHQHDLIFASNNSGILGHESGNPNVALQFSHILSKVKAKFTTKFPKEYQIEISNVTINSINDQGDYDPVQGWFNHSQTVDDQTLTMLGGTNTLTLQNKMVVDDEGNEKPMSVATGQYYVIPTKGKNTKVEDIKMTYALQFTIDVYIGTDRVNKVMSKTLTGEFTPAWGEGYQYVYNVDINGTTTNMQVISFTTTVDEFGTPEDSENDITEFVVKDNGVGKPNNE